MTLERAFLRALEEGGDWPIHGIGLCDAALNRDPTDVEAQVYRGALFTRVDASLLSPARRDAYHRAGQAEMDEAFGRAVSNPWLMRTASCVAGIALAALPETSGTLPRAAQHLARLDTAPLDGCPPPRLLAVGLALRARTEAARTGDVEAAQALDVAGAALAARLWKLRT